MNESKHTPGPWKANNDYGRHWVSAGSGKKRIQIADVSDVEMKVGAKEVDVDEEQTKANARLIASAPDLLRQRDALRAACETIAELRKIGRAPFPGEWDQLEAALALCRDAEGGAS